MNDCYTEQTELERLEGIITKTSNGNLGELLRAWVLVVAVSMEQKRMKRNQRKNQHKLLYD